MTVNGETRIIGIIGNPVRHTMSPAIHNYISEQLNKNMIYVPFEVTGDVAAAVKGAFELGILGMNVTVPWKSEVIKSLVDIDDMAKRIGAVNTLVRKENGYKGILFPIVQGNFFEDLRKQSAEFVSELDTQGIAIGGLSVGEPADMFTKYLNYTVQYLPEDKPKYVMGIGTPEYILDAVQNGIDMFDCVLPTRNARNGSYFTHHGNLSIKQERFIHDLNPVDSQCNCKVCRNYSRSYLRHLFKEQEILSCMLATYHNLYFLNNMMKEIRQAIKEDRFTQYREEFLKQFHSGEL